MARATRTYVDDRLKEVPLFSSCSRQELRDISRRMVPIAVDAGTPLAEQGKLGSEFVVVIEGHAEVVRDGRRVATLGPGDWFGEVALLDDRRVRTATVAALTPMQLEVVDVRDFNALIDEQPRVARKLLQGLAGLVAGG